MPWFYAHAGQQIGPVADAELERLAREGVVQPTTLVWREGMQNWEAYAAVAMPQSSFVAEPNPDLPPRPVICRECGKNVLAEETVRFGEVAICVACKPQYVQKLREGKIPPPPAGPLAYAGFWV